ncbi:hypothetical protein [Pontibaca salina]|uniref:Uncharacterized protein n=1 Tax=Pontibaca salina TaxID=2795731 RepID=A0A934M0T8_9RHOB|nr:hypothetical protein [Pontibaca salina]MBI6628991.1 hypothetical protein [Pontibaca salina]
MTNPIALVLGFLITALAATDLILFGSQHMVFLGKRIFDLIEWLAFWR